MQTLALFGILKDADGVSGNELRGLIYISVKPSGSGLGSGDGNVVEGSDHGVSFTLGS